MFCPQTLLPLTAANGRRPKTMAWFKQTWPNANFA